MDPLISICIPAYKRTEFLKRLLDSIIIQTFKNFEVIVTDDSPGSEVHELCIAYKNKLPLVYFRNNQPLGTPENWNEAIRNAKGKWIKLMHDDDWFSTEKSLELFTAAIRTDPQASFLFSAYRKVHLGESRQEEIFVNSFRYKMLRKNPVTLLSKNIIGPPSVVLHRNDHQFFYDKKLKWLVDIDFYIRCLQSEKPHYIHHVLMNVGMSPEQVTKETFRVREVEIPENFYLLGKVGSLELKNILVYDAWWRLLRNLRIKNTEDIRDAGYSGALPSEITAMIYFQSKINPSILGLGFFSKLLMFVSYLFNKG